MRNGTSDTGTSGTLHGSERSVGVDDAVRALACRNASSSDSRTMAKSSSEHESLGTCVAYVGSPPDPARQHSAGLWLWSMKLGALALEAGGADVYAVWATQSAHVLVKI